MATTKQVKDIRVGDTIITPGHGHVAKVVYVHVFGGKAPDVHILTEEYENVYALPDEEVEVV